MYKETYINWMVKQEDEDEGFSIEEMMFYDDLLDDD